MKRGVIAGKFVPPHLGHKYLIDMAAAQCDKLTVLVCDRPEYPIPVKQRLIWLRTIHPDVTFLPIKDTMDDDDSATWATATIDLLGYVPDVVFSSEDYGPRWAKHMGCAHVSIDKSRQHIPISATAVRADPWANWRYLHPLVRAYFAWRICVVGAESTGTTTLTRSLAQHYHTQWVPEYGRTYTIKEQQRLARDGWQTTDFVAIAREQNRQEDALAAATNKLLFCDTDSFATSIWHERYMGTRSHQVEKLAHGRSYDLYLLTDINIPFEQDGIRDGEHLREWMHGRFQEKLRFWSKPYVIISGSPEERRAQATKLITMVIKNNAVALPGLTRNAWHPIGGF